MTLPLHGGDLAAAEALWGRPAQGWLDLSTGINPWPYPLPALAAEAWTRLPGAAEERALTGAAARRWHAPGPDRILAAPGSSALIQALPRLLPPGDMAVLGPTYGEHARAWAAAGHAVRRISSLDEVGGAAAVVVVNPNNPDGRTLAPDRLAALTGGGRLVVADEAFADATPEGSAIPLLRPGLVVLRSFGKFYGLAGLRLGFAVAEPALLDRLTAQLGPWPVSGPALAVGAAALGDEAWTTATRARLSDAASRLDAVLISAGLTIIGGTTLFRLAEHPLAGEVYQRLGRAGILVRAFADQPSRLRFGLPASEGDGARLRQALG
jgi:cobalamin biosynthetic protein CobC